MSADTKTKQLLLVDAVAWSAAYPQDDPRRNVHQWYARWLTGLADVTLSRVSAEADVVQAAEAGVDGIIISGSPRDAWNDDPVNHKLCEVVRLCQERRTPLLGVCYGHQILARALGGVVDRHPAGWEVGDTTVVLTAAGQASSLFRDCRLLFPSSRAMRMRCWRCRRVENCWCAVILV